ncbi:hypothetical protein OROGR_010276 [Orobanche gracilis]
MAVDVCTEISSPRISFSYDLKELDFVPVENHDRRSDSPLSNPAIDFDFGIGHGFPHHEISSADELFANGRILPVGIKRITSNPPKQTHLPQQIPAHHSHPHKNDVVLVTEEKKKKKRLLEFLSNSLDADEEDEKPSSKPFWKFKRSSSANCENGRANGFLRFRSLQFLTRSNSTGSVPNPSPYGVSKSYRKQQSLKEGSIDYRNNNNNITTSKKPSLRKSTSRSCGNNGVRFNPVLNIPPAYIAKGTFC